jgi:vesicle-fusing ATPase
LTDVGLAETFDSELRVPPISSLSALDYVLREVRLFPTKEAHREALDMLSQAGFGAESRNGISVGIKKLLSMIEMARQEPDNTALRLTSALSGLGM